MSKNTALDSMETMLKESGSSHTVLLTSFRRNGQARGTPVGMRSANRKLYFMTPASTWKASHPHATRPTGALYLPGQGAQSTCRRHRATVGWG